MPDNPAPRKPGLRRLWPILVVDAVFLVAIVATVRSGTGSEPAIGPFSRMEALGIGFALASALATVLMVVLSKRGARAEEQRTVWTREDR